MPALDCRPVQGEAEAEAGRPGEANSPAKGKKKKKKKPAEERRAAAQAEAEAAAADKAAAAPEEAASKPWWPHNAGVAPLPVWRPFEAVS